MLLSFGLTYMFFYNGRQNINLVMTQMADGLGSTTAAMGVVSSALFWCYAFGQLVNGRLGAFFGYKRFMMFGVAYIIAALMTTGALVFYFRAILKSCSAYMLGGFVALVYMLNYMLLQMETYALLAGSLVLFLLLCVVMYLTADMSKNKELPKAE